MNDLAERATGRVWRDWAMETNEVSLHLVKVFDAAKSHGGWLTSKRLAELSGVAPRTSRAHARRLVDLGMFDLAEVFPGHRYRLSALAEKRNKAMFQRLDNARDAFFELRVTLAPRGMAGMAGMAGGGGRVT
jgi:hypothetical protein